MDHPAAGLCSAGWLGHAAKVCWGGGWFGAGDRGATTVGAIPKLCGGWLGAGNARGSTQVLDVAKPC